MPRPSGMPTQQASRNAPKTRTVEISTCCQNGVPVKPSFDMAMNFSTIDCGDGTKRGFTQPMVVTSHQTNRRAAMVSRLSQSVSPDPGTP